MLQILIDQYIIFQLSCSNKESDVALQYHSPSHTGLTGISATTEMDISSSFVGTCLVNQVFSLPRTDLRSAGPLDTPKFF
jgi:hypothetical protein